MDTTTHQNMFVTMAIGFVIKGNNDAFCLQRESLFIESVFSGCEHVGNFMWSFNQKHTACIVCVPIAGLLMENRRFLQT